MDLTDPATAYPSRTLTFTAGTVVTSATLNAIQDGIIAVGDAVETLVDELAAQAAQEQTATCNQADTPAPDLGGGRTVWVEKETNGTTVVVLDNAIDWRDRWIEVSVRLDNTDAHMPGGASDNTADQDQHYTVPASFAHGIFYSRDGQTGSALSTEVFWFGNRGASYLNADKVLIFADSSNGGALTMKKNATADSDVWVIGRISGSPTQNHY